MILIDIGFQCNGPAEVVVPYVLPADSRRTDHQFAQGDGAAIGQGDSLAHQVVRINVPVLFCQDPDLDFFTFILEVRHQFTVHVSLQRPSYDCRIQTGPLYGLTIKAQHQFRVAGTIIQGDVSIHLLLFKKITQVISCPQHGRIITAQNLCADGLARRWTSLYFQDGDFYGPRHISDTPEDCVGDFRNMAALTGLRVQAEHNLAHGVTE